VRTNSGARQSTYRLACRTVPANRVNQYTSVGGQAFTHDANGNLTSDGSNIYAYDDENRLIGVTGGHTANLAYDPLGRLYRVWGGAEGDRRFLYQNSGDTKFRGHQIPGTWRN
jgi:hypothetical protein